MLEKCRLLVQGRFLKCSARAWEEGSCSNRHEFRLPSSVNLVQIIYEILLSILQNNTKYYTIWAVAFCTEFPESSSRPEAQT
eukprot:s4086_g11.t1